MSMLDVVIVGAGPAGSVAAIVLARAGATVRILDRATFPRDKLCGDTVNPGTLARLRHLNLAQALDRSGLRVDGMLVTGEGGVAIEGRYPRDLGGRSLCRSDLDWALLQQAMDAGARFEPAVTVRGGIVNETRRGPMVEAVAIGAGSLRARVIIAADGRRSTLAFGLGLARHPARPRRWAIGAYFENASPSAAASLGEMHIRPGRYIGVAPVPGGLTNVCLVRSLERVPTPYVVSAFRRTRHGPATCPEVFRREAGHYVPQPSGRRSSSDENRLRSGNDDARDFRDPAALLRRELERDVQLRDRFVHARLVRPPVVLGPLAVDAVDRTLDGLILAGDAAGFIDPMTGDGLRFAVRGGELAAAAAIDALQHGWTGVHAALAAARRREFAAKWRFNRALRMLVAWPPAIRAAEAGARVSPALVRAIVARAGDCDLADVVS